RFEKVPIVGAVHAFEHDALLRELAFEHRRTQNVRRNVAHFGQFGDLRDKGIVDRHRLHFAFVFFQQVANMDVAAESDDFLLNGRFESEDDGNGDFHDGDAEQNAQNAQPNDEVRDGTLCPEGNAGGKTQFEVADKREGVAPPSACPPPRARTQEGAEGGEVGKRPRKLEYKFEEGVRGGFARLKSGGGERRKCHQDAPNEERQQQPQHHAHVFERRGDQAAEQKAAGKGDKQIKNHSVNKPRKLQKKFGGWRGIPMEGTVIPTERSDEESENTDAPDAQQHHANPKPVPQPWNTTGATKRRDFSLRSK
ncbi:MAG: hypothetical protein RLZZ519_1743, partial [Bacteroidota bacterium]